MNQNISEKDYKTLYDFFVLIAPLSQEQFRSIKLCLKKKTYQKGDSILKSGQIETRSNFVIKGVVHQFIYDNNVAVSTNITPKGLVFNSIKSYVEGSPSLEVQEAITDVELLYIEKKDMERLVMESHQISYLLYKIHENILLDRENRMFLLQSRSPAKRYALFHEIVFRSNWLLEDTPDKYIASYLNMTPQQYSKEKSKAGKSKK